MSMTKASQLTAEHNDWLRGLVFYKDELVVLKNRLTEIAGKNTGDEAGQGAGHFESQFTIQVTNIDTLRHDIQQHLSQVATQAENHAGHIEKDMVAAHNDLRERYIAEEKVINDLRHEFYRYASKWM